MVEVDDVEMTMFNRQQTKIQQLESRIKVLEYIIEREASSLELFMHNKSSQSSHLKAIALRLRAALEVNREL
jgi:hypothetical protein